MLPPDLMDDGSADAKKNIVVTGPKLDWTFSFELRPDSLRTFNPLPLLTHTLMEVPGLRPHSGHLYTILSELYSNALEHGLLGLSSDLKHSASGFAEYYDQRAERLATLTDQTVTIELEHSPTAEGGLLKITIKDDGAGFDYSKKVNNKHKTEGYCGRGIPLIRTLCSSIQYYGDGNHVEVVFPWYFKDPKKLDDD